MCVWEWMRSKKFKDVTVDMDKVERIVFAELSKPTAKEIQMDEDTKAAFMADPWGMAVFMDDSHNSPEEIAQRTQDVRYHFCQRRPR